jgi:hypothetical protein
MTHTLHLGMRSVVSSDPRPVELAVVDEILDNFGPLKWLTISFETTGGGLRWYEAWTTGGERVGDEIDTTALGLGLDGADWLAIIERHRATTHRGNVKIDVYDLLRIRTDVQVKQGQDSPDMRDAVRRFLVAMATEFPDKYRFRESDPPPSWGGVGPRLNGRR